MKKRWGIFAVLGLLILVCLLSKVFLFDSCFSFGADSESAKKQSEAKFQDFLLEIQKIVVSYGFVAEEAFDENIEEEICHKDIVISLDSKDKITIRLLGGTHETFELSYEMFGNKEANFDLDLLTEIIEVISGKPVTREFCEEFLRAPEDEYFDPSKMVDNDNLLIQKYASLNFFEDWTVSYTLDIELKHSLRLWGKIK